MKHALVIEDNHVIAMMISEELVEFGYETVDIATSQDQAIEQAKIRCPDLITVDDKLDSGTGIDTIREICREQAIPVVFVSADAYLIQVSIPHAIVVRKPFSRAQLTAAIRAAVRAPMTVDHLGS